jgi:hypothetical protein
MAETIKANGGLDVLVNNVGHRAGRGQRRFHPGRRGDRRPGTQHVRAERVRPDPDAPRVPDAAAASSAPVVASLSSGASLMGELGNPGYVGGDAGAVEWLTPVF